jgi:D-glycero-alpha-D-manno-heptose-7-phosphate kinase
VGLIRALSALKGDAIGKRELACKALELEQNVLKENVGSQDQIAAAYGGLNVIHFLPDGSFRVDPLKIPAERAEEFEKHLLLLYTGTSRMGGEIAASVIAAMRDKSAELRRMRQLVDEAVGILSGRESVEKIGELLHETWLLKRGLAEGVTSSEVDEIYRIARENGAIGGKLLGAGAKGFMLFFVPPEKQAAVRRALERFVWVPFQFETEGSATIYGDIPAPAGD